MAAPILVIGGAGFIGPRLVRRLLARGETVVCMDVNTAAPSPDTVTVIRGDVTRFEDVLKTIVMV
jgi:nucleoside-diphosphate-sugar epimerase